MPLSSVVGAQSIVRPGVCTSTTRPASPYDGQVIYMSDVDQTAVWDGSAWVGIERSRDRNVIINGAMQVAQRGTSTTGKTGGGYATVDRFQAVVSGLGTWTETVENDAPTGSGFRKSWKLTCTTANASPAAGNYMVAYQIIEGQNTQQFAKGTALAKQFALSFWVKGNTTGTYIVELYDNNNTRAVSASYTINTSDTWEKKIIIFPADTTGSLNNDNGNSLTVQWWLGAGTTFTSGSLATTWGAVTNANRAVGQTNLAGATSRAWQVTGIQLEAGAVATPFEFEDYSTTFAKCQRYFQIPNQWVTFWNTSTTTAAGGINFTTRFRAAPVAVAGTQNSTFRYGPGGQRSTTLITFQDYSDSSVYAIVTDNGGTPFTTNYPSVHNIGAQFSAEL